MDDKRESKEVLEIKTSKKNLKETPKVNSKDELEVIIAYSQIVVYTLQNSATELTPKAIREEVKMFYNKFGNENVKKMANAILKEKKEKK